MPVCGLPFPLKWFIMRFIPTRVHGMLDYLIGILLIAAPWLFDLDRGALETWIPVTLGAGTLLYSSMTNYELGLTKTLSMRTHLTLDLMSGFISCVAMVIRFCRLCLYSIPDSRSLRDWCSVND